MVKTGNGKNNINILSRLRFISKLDQLKNLSFSDPLKIPKNQFSPELKNVFSINSFEIGKNQLGPMIFDLLNKLQIEIKEIHLDNVAKIRLLGMSPSFEQRIEKGDPIDQICSDLGLSLFIKQNEQILYILGDKQNISLMNKLAEETRSSSKKSEALDPWQAVQEIEDEDRNSLMDRRFNAGPYAIRIINPESKKFTFEIKGVSMVRRYLTTKERVSETSTITIRAQIEENGIRLFFPNGQSALIYPFRENISCEYDKAADSKEVQVTSEKIYDFNLRQIIEALLNEIRTLGDEQNTSTPKIQITTNLFQAIRQAKNLDSINKKLLAGLHTIEIENTDKDEFTFNIKDVQAQISNLTRIPTPPVSFELTPITLRAQVFENGITLSHPEAKVELGTYDPFTEDVSEAWKEEYGVLKNKPDGKGKYWVRAGYKLYKLFRLDLRRITEALLNEIKKVDE